MAELILVLLAALVANLLAAGCGGLRVEKTYETAEDWVAMTDGINDRRPMKPISGPVLRAKPMFVEHMPHCETCERTYLDATGDEIFYRCEPEGLVRCCECLRREQWDV